MTKRFVLCTLIALLILPSGLAQALSASNQGSNNGVVANLVLYYNSKSCDGHQKYQITGHDQWWTRSSTGRGISDSQGKFGTTLLTQCDNQTYYQNSRDIGRTTFDWNGGLRTQTYSSSVTWNYTGPPGVSPGNSSGWQLTHVTDGNGHALGDICVTVVLYGSQSCT